MSSPPPGGSEGPAISIVIRTFNSAATLGHVLDQLRLAGGDELIVVDSGSTDQTVEMARRAGAQILQAPLPFHYSTALNAGFHIATNPWVWALSSHCIPTTPEIVAIYRRVAAAAEPSVACIVGSAHSNAKATSGERVLAYSLESVGGRLWELPQSNANSLYRREVWLRHPFSTEVETAEDLEWVCWAAREGKTILRAEAASISYHNKANLRRMYYKGRVETKVGVRLTQRTNFRPRWVMDLLYGALQVLRGRMPPGAWLRRAAYCLGMAKTLRELRRQEG